MRWHAVEACPSKTEQKQSEQISAAYNKQQTRTYILLAATAADKLKIGTELIINRSSCIV